MLMLLLMLLLLMVMMIMLLLLLFLLLFTTYNTCYAFNRLWNCAHSICRFSQQYKTISPGSQNLLQHSWMKPRLPVDLRSTATSIAVSPIEGRLSISRFVVLRKCTAFRLCRKGSGKRRRKRSSKNERKNWDTVYLWTTFLKQSKKK